MFSKLLLQLDNDSLMSGKQKMGGRGVTGLVSEKKRIENLVFLEALVV